MLPAKAHKHAVTSSLTSLQSSVNVHEHHMTLTILDSETENRVQFMFYLSELQMNTNLNKVLNNV